MNGFIYVVSLWMTLLISAESSENGNHGVCKLNNEAASHLCTIAKLIEEAKHITEKHHYKDVGEVWVNIQYNKDVVDHRVNNLPGIIETAKTKGTLTDKDAENLKKVYSEAHEKNTEQHKNAETAIKVHNKTHEAAKNSSRAALGEGRTRSNCYETSSLLDILQCHVQGTESKGASATFSEVCKGANYNQDINTLLTNCIQISKSKTYCNGTGAALKTALDRWKNVSKAKDTANSGSNGETCNVKDGWESYAHNASEHMRHLDEHVQALHDANLLTTAYFSVVHKMREDIEKGKTMKEIVENARKAGQEGAKVMVERPDANTIDDIDTQSGKTTKPVEEEVKVTVQLDGLKFDEENMPAHSKESFPKIYIYLLAILLPLCCIVIGVTMFCILRRARSTHVEKSIPVDGATMSKAGGTHAQF